MAKNSVPRASEEYVLVPDQLGRGESIRHAPVPMVMMQNTCLQRRRAVYCTRCAPDETASSQLMPTNCVLVIILGIDRLPNENVN